MSTKFAARSHIIYYISQLTTLLAASKFYITLDFDIDFFKLKLDFGSIGLEKLTQDHNK